ncbi:heparinase II/III family protein [Larkinella soli]|uniref:heparinase II/III family protein n=1 Tax=Larkinella soli TaxID=1770527 RepID=UPI000FFB9E38|nr:alginate lyase family protein [Larkinella soli]
MQRTKIISHYYWFFNRFRELTNTEVLLRFRHYVRKQADRKQAGRTPSVSLLSWPDSILTINPAGFPAISFRTEQAMFGHTLDYRYPVDWHLDISTGKRFPTEFAPNIDVGHPKAGNVYYVRQVNRQFFLQMIALRFRLTDDSRHLNRFTTLLTSWVKANPYLRGVNWTSNTEVSLRLINWFLCWNILDVSGLVQTDPAFRRFVETVWLPSIHQHCAYLYANTPQQASTGSESAVGFAGLFMAGSFWPFPDSVGWNIYAMTGIERAMQRYGFGEMGGEQADCPMPLLTDFFVLAWVTGLRTGYRLSADYLRGLRNRFDRIAQLLDTEGNHPLCRPDDAGRLLDLDDPWSFNDFCSLLTSGAILFQDPLFKRRSRGFDLRNLLLFGEEGLRGFEAVPVEEAEPKSRYFSREGHFVLRKKERENGEIYVYFDAGKPVVPRPDQHADALSFVMHIDGKPFFVDSGRYFSPAEPGWSGYFAGTRAHNTVCIDYQDQAEPAPDAGHRFPAATTVLRAQGNDYADEIIAAHNGYDRMGCAHERRLEFDRIRNRLLIGDRIDNRESTGHTVEVLFHLHPAVRFRARGRNHFVLSHPGTKRLVTLLIDPKLQVEVISGQVRPTPLGWYSEGFDQKQPASVFRAYLSLGGEDRVSLNHQISVE